MERKGRIGSLLREEGPLLGEEWVGPWFTPWGEERWALSGFLKDPSLAEKQLVAMGDLATNRIPSLPAPRHRPSPVSCYPGNLSVSAWWPAWRSFMFSPLGPNQSAPAERMRTLKAGQFAAIKMREEAASRAMQALALAIFDASLLHLLQSLFSYEGWTEPRKQARSKPNAPLIEARSEKTLRILSSGYGKADVLLLQ
ncbi:MAG: hypothetical protein SGPRY_005000, partial [Prymnesium sp.]